MIKCVTRNRPKAFLPCLFVVILSLSLFGCGGTFRSFPNEGDVSGNWTLFLASSGTSSIGPKVMTLAQTDKNIVGTTADGATITGTVSGNDVVLTLHNAGGSTTTLAGTAGGDWKTMSGTYTSTGSDGSGTWSATKIIPTPTPTPTPAPLAVNLTSTTLSCSGTTGVPTSQTFTVTGGTPANYSASTSSTLVTLSAFTIGTTTRQFTVTANACVSDTDPANGTTFDLTVTDTVNSVNVRVTISNP